MAIYLKYGNVDGDATQTGFEKWINCNTFSWPLGIKRYIDTLTGKGRNREGRQPDVADIIITKELDSATGPLLKAIVSGEGAEKCKIAFVSTSDPGETYLEYTLTDTLLASVRLDGPDRPVETWSLDFTEIEIDVTRLNADNKAVEPFKFTYSIKTGKGQ
jgi:type VI secretion system secreted protein Hcp